LGLFTPARRRENHRTLGWARRPGCKTAMSGHVPKLKRARPEFAPEQTAAAAIPTIPQGNNLLQSTHQKTYSRSPPRNCFFLGHGFVQKGRTFTAQDTTSALVGHHLTFQPYPSGGRRRLHAGQPWHYGRYLGTAGAARGEILPPPPATPLLRWHGNRASFSRSSNAGPCVTRAPGGGMDGLAQPSKLWPAARVRGVRLNFAYRIPSGQSAARVLEAEHQASCTGMQ